MPPINTQSNPPSTPPTDNPNATQPSAQPTNTPEINPPSTTNNMPDNASNNTPGKKKIDLSEIQGLLMSLLVSIGLVVFGLFMLSQVNKQSSWTTTDGTVIKVDTSYNYGSDRDTTKYTPTLEYSVNGQTYQIKDNSSSSGPSIGSKKQVTYNPTNPGEAASKKGTIDVIFAYGLMFAGVVLGIFSGFYYIKNRKNT